MLRQNILFSTDEKYCPHVATAICSLVVNNSDIFFDIYLFHSSLSIASQTKLSSVVDSTLARIHFIEISHREFQGMPLGCHFTKPIYYRLLAANHIAGDTCLYLDSDIIVTGSLANLFSIYLGNSLLAAVVDQGFRGLPSLGLSPGAKYFNSGVILINLSMWRTFSMASLVVQVIDRNPSSVWFPDQCGLNAVVDGNFLELEACYNYQSSLADACCPISSVSGDSPLIVHFSGHSKPWYLNNKHPYKGLYWYYRNKTPFRSLWSDDLSLNTVIRKLLPSSIKRCIRKLLP